MQRYVASVTLPSRCQKRRSKVKICDGVLLRFILFYLITIIFCVQRKTYAECRELYGYRVQQNNLYRALK